MYFFYEKKNFFNTPCAKLDFAHARIKKHALNQALYVRRIKKCGSIRERGGDFNLV